MEKMTSAEFRKQYASTDAKPSKYMNVKTVYDNMIFDSKKELSRYLELKLLEKAGKISHLYTQYLFELQKSNKEKKLRAINYRADFVYLEGCKKKNRVAEDVKPFDKKSGKFRLTAEFKLKQKLFAIKYPDWELRIV
jgi:hypothetical protein